jgi:hypothetical protein
MGGLCGGGSNNSSNSNSGSNSSSSNSFSENLANSFTPNDGASYVNGQLVDDRTGERIAAGGTSSAGRTIAGSANSERNDYTGPIFSGGSNNSVEMIIVVLRHQAILTTDISRQSNWAL